MSRQSERTELISAFREYLQDLQESGADWLELPQRLTSQPMQGSSPPLVKLTEQFIAPDSNAAETLADIRADLGDCHCCQLANGRTNLVFGEGNPNARVVFVGEGPGREEDLQGEPFVGEAGKLLTKIIESMGFQRSDIYICNVVKCRPPQNRDPLQPEIDACSSFMLRQVKAINPDIIVALGKFAAQTLLKVKTPISRLRGTFHEYHGIPLMPTFHPAALLREPLLKRDVWNDMKLVLDKLGMPVPEVQRKGQ